ncbi:MAG: GcrA cell cycle regulator [Rhizobiales bacterium]|nr:GcrA cell cycle regulator [Hyphomicrobiales bacterium]
MSWTDERVELPKKLWGDGLSASQIAAQLGGVTRNAVIGKVRSFVSGNTALKVHAQPAPRRAPAPVPIEDLVVPISLNVSLLALNDQMCKWPIGDPGADGFHFCGHRSFNSLPYCEYHSRVAYQPVNDRRRDRDRREY